MSGNVHEWISDKYGNYTSEPKINPTGAATGDSMNRGGSCGWDTKTCRVSRRGHLGAWQSSKDIGFRLVLP